MSFQPPAFIRGVSRFITYVDPSPIAGLWQSAEEAGLLAIETPCWAAYHSYTDTGYTLTVGTLAGAQDAAPEGQDVVAVPEQTWRHFPTDGTIPGLQSAWQGVWQQATAGNLARTQFDIERWVRQADGQTEADIYVGVAA